MGLCCIKALFVGVGIFKMKKLLYRIFTGLTVVCVGNKKKEIEY